MPSVTTDETKPFSQTTPRIIANLLDKALNRYPTLKNEVQGFTEFDAHGFACRSPNNLKELLGASFWRKWHPLLNACLEEIVSSDKVDETKLIDWLLLKYLDISIDAKELTSSLQPNAYFAKPNPDSIDHQLHLYYLQPFSLFGIVAQNRKFSNNSIRSQTQWLWHANAEDQSDSAPLFRKIIQLYILSHIIDLANDPKYANLKNQVPKLKFKYHVMLQEFILEMETLFKVISKPSKWTVSIRYMLPQSGILLQQLFPFLSLLLWTSAMELALRYPIISMTTDMFALMVLLAPPTLALIYAFSRYLVSRIPVSAISFMKESVKTILKKLDHRFGTTFSSQPAHQTIIPDNEAKPNLEAPINICAEISSDLKEKANKLFSQLGKLNQSFNLTPEVKTQIKACLNKLNPDLAKSTEEFKATIEQASALLKNNFEANEVTVMRQLIAHLQTKEVVVDSKENMAIRLQPQQGYQPSLTLLKTLHSQGIIKDDGSWTAIPNLNIPVSVQEKCKRIEAAMKP